MKAYEIDAVGTPRGRGTAGNGALSGVHPQELLATVLRAPPSRTGFDARDVELTDAETALTQARLDGIDPFIDRRIADARLRQATGDPVESSAP